MLAAAVLAAGVLIWLNVQKESGQDEVSSAPQVVYTGEDFVMDTYVTQRVSGDSGEKAIEEDSAMLMETEQTFSRFRSDSVISEINAQAGIAPVEVPEEVLGVLKEGLAYSAQSEGLFQMTIAPLADLWGIMSDSPKVPGADEISNALSYVDDSQAALDEEAGTVFLPRPGISLDLGALVKGYAAGKAREIYEENQVDSALLSLGGMIVTVGRKPEGEPFQIGLRDPEGGASDYFGILSGDGRIISTSGGYERYFEQDGKRYHHILDPRTGYPAESGLLSVTVLCNDGMKADFLSTTLYIAGTEAVKSHLNEPDYSIIAVTDDRQVLVSGDLAESFSLTEDSGYTLAE